MFDIFVIWWAIGVITCVVADIYKYFTNEDFEVTLTEMVVIVFVSILGPLLPLFSFIEFVADLISRPAITIIPSRKQLKINRFDKRITEKLKD